MSVVSETSQNRPDSPPVVVNDNNTVTVHPRRKSGSYRDSPVVTVTLERLSKLYGHSVEEAARQLGLSATALRRVCRKLGINKWPYERKQVTPSQLGEDEFELDDDDKIQEDFDFCASSGTTSCSHDDQEYIQRAILFHMSSQRVSGHNAKKGSESVDAEDLAEGSGEDSSSSEELALDKHFIAEFIRGDEGKWAEQS
ncbi:hypothetical protein GUITHDRAFT_145487 [Guillardia theta CCMP2712]|uniref:RWP-RK domain-containing protein n=1 Tax=Guillardia theta (strain CCMP2712) TaxID=905079 RepID=L1IKT1_GUITC|nr:hypothetical protein GUITHDRAFT_145487 [Guillardia theta CCMP2712]EKX36737.1 hypothetical protein GUITHDRAFT_145487 [Guillardia theta CCMP2712]|eukprot:XP_005823717.1 hypothetical protein GUITHDRAFT_145487 [Guillardia theta CCMP2712]